MKVLLIYYTGTYNTRYLTEKVKARFVCQGNQVDTVEININTPVVDTDGYDLVGFSYPIYGFNSPLPFNKYVRKLKFNKNQKYFIYKNSGETFGLNNASSRILIRIMRRNKAQLVGEYHFVMPYNIHFPFESDFVREILVKNEKLMDIMFYNINNGIVQKIHSNFIYNLSAFVVGIQKLGGNINSYLYKVDENKCVNCNLCVKNCPENNIYLKDGKIKFHHHCDMCMRCSFFCPTNAINIGFLEGWKVNGAYDFKGAESMGAPEKPYITKESKGFYKCFIKHFAKIDVEYDKLFLKDAKNQ